MFEMQTLAGNSGVKVTLRVPIKGAGNIRYVEYIRLYYNNRCADVQNNEGGMTEFKFTGFIMPQVRFNNEQDAIYTVSCVQSATGRNEFRFLVMVKNPTKSCTCRNEDQQIMVKADNYLLEKGILISFKFVTHMDIVVFCCRFSNSKGMLNGLSSL